MLSTRIMAQLANREKQRARIWKAFELTGDEETFTQSIGQLQREVEALQRERLSLQQETEAHTQFKPDPQDIQKACDLVRRKLKCLSLEDKRQAMEALQEAPMSSSRLRPSWLLPASSALFGQYNIPYTLPNSMGDNPYCFWVPPPICVWRKPARPCGI